MKFEFSEDWFSRNIPIWEKALAHFRDKEISALEIGSYEGRSTVWLLQNILTHPQATITCIDTFKGGREHKGADFEMIRRRFFLNTYQWRDSLTVYERESREVLKQIEKKFDLIYVDGSHEERDVLVDAVLSHLLLKPDGVIIFDDFLWKDGEESPYVPKGAINAFFTCFSKEYKPVSLGYQLILQKRGESI